LPDSLITLEQGVLQTPANVDNLTLQGPGSNSLLISGNLSDRVLTHVGMGTLTINNLTIERGSFVTPLFSPAFIEGDAYIRLPEASP
jgi:hypothetical protein